MTKQLEEIKAKAVPILKEAGVKRSSVFGSYARGDFNKKSDVDILVDFPSGKGLFAFIHLQNQLEDVLRKKVDLVTYKGIKPRLKERILSEQIRIL